MNVEDRVTQLERQNRNMKVFLGVILLVICSAFLVGAGGANSNEYIIGYKGKIRGMFGVDKNGAGTLSLNGNKDSMMVLTDGGIGFFDDNGQLRVNFGLNPKRGQEGSLTFFDANGKTIKEIP